MRGLVLFDFDGTLADSLEVALDAYNAVAPSLGAPRISADDTQLRHMTPRDALATTGIPMWKVPRLVSAVRTQMKARMHEIRLFDGVADVLRELGRADLRCGIVSSNSQENIEACLARHALSGIEILGTGTSLFGKAAALRKVLRRERVEASEALYVGDEGRDIVAATEIGMPSIAVSWGYAARSALEAERPTAIADSPEALIRLVLDRFERARLERV